MDANPQVVTKGIALQSKKCQVKIDLVNCREIVETDFKRKATSWSKLEPREVSRKQKNFYQFARTTANKRLISQLDTSQLQSDVTLNQLVADFMKNDNPQTMLADYEMPSKEDNIATRKCQEEAYFDPEEGHYYCPIPLREENPAMPNTRPMAIKRLLLLKSTFRKKPEQFEDYKGKMLKLIQEGHAELAPEGEPDLFILPHFAAFHPFKPGVRVVFDCAAKVDGISLNSVALSGPNEFSLMMKVFTGWRKHRFRYMGDIRSMFYQVRVPRKQRAFLRFLWWPDGNLDAEPVMYQLTVHLFGGTWSPFVSAFIKYYLEQVKETCQLVDQG